MIEDLLKAGLLEALEKFGVFEEDIDILLEKPRDRSHGDLSTNLAMVLGKRMDRKPRELAGEIAAGIDYPRNIVESVEIAGPGFINFRLAPAFQVDLMLDLMDPEGALAAIRTGGNKRINVEFISANPTGPLNVVSARAGAFGMTLVRLLDAIGYDAHSEYYVNDAGRQVKMLGLSLRAHYLQLVGEPVEFPEDGYHGRYLEIMAQELLDQDSEAIAKAASVFNDESFQRVKAPGGNAEDWRNLPEAESVKCFSKFALMTILSWQRDTCRKFGLRFETWYFESELHESKRVERVFDKLEKLGVLYEQEGATWFRSTDFGDEEDRVVMRTDGTPTYFLADIAYHYHKSQRGFEHAIDFWGPDHHGHILRMQCAMEALGIPRDWLEVQILQQVNFVEGGRSVKMAKRAGKFVTMDELITDVGADVAKYIFLTRKPNSHLDFDLDLAKEQSNENPVFKVKYAHARICQVLRKAEAAGIEPGKPTASSLGKLIDEAEWNLVRELIRLPQVIVSAANAREPHRLTGYTGDVASLFNQFYQRPECKILGEDKELTLARLHLCLVTRHVLRVVLELIGVDAPEELEVKV